MYYSTHRPWWGPTFPLSKLELAVMSASGIALDSIPKGAMHCAEKEKKKNGIFGYARFLDTPPLINMIYWKTFITRDTYDRSRSKNSYYSYRRYRPKLGSEKFDSLTVLLNRPLIQGPNFQ